MIEAGSGGGLPRPSLILAAVVLATGIGSFTSTAPLAAQESVPATAAAPLTLEQAVALALEHNPAYLRERNLISSAEYAERSSLGAMLPSLNGSLSFSGNTSRSKTAVDEFGRPLEEAQFVESTNSRASQGVSGNISLFDLGSIRDYRAARAQTAAREAGADYQAAVLRREVGQSYFDAVRRQELVSVEERALRTAEEQRAAIAALLRVAAKDPTDVLGAELTVSQAEQALHQARGEAQKARLALKSTLGVPMARAFELTSGFPAVFDPATLELETLLVRALGGSPRLEQQRAGLAAAERSVSAARAARFPTLSGSYDWGRGIFMEDYGAFGELDPPNQSWGFGVSVGIPLFNRLQTHSAIGRAEVDALNARESLREARLQLEREVRSALIDLENAWTSVRLAEQSADIARRRLEQGRERYRLGTIDYTALQDMINAVAREERGVINAYYNFSVSLLTLEEKVGGPVGG